MTVDFPEGTTDFALLGHTNALIEFVLACLLSSGFQLAHKATCRGGGGLTRPSHDARVRLGGLTIWRVPCTTCHAVCTVLPHVVWRAHQRRPEVARAVL